MIDYDSDGGYQELGPRGVDINLRAPRRLSIQ